MSRARTFRPPVPSGGRRIARPRLFAALCVLLIGSACTDAVPGPTDSLRASSGSDGAWLPILPAVLPPLSGAAPHLVGPLLAGAAPPATRERRDPPESAVLYWNGVARGLVAAHAVNPPHASRIYALLSVAQYDALVALRRPGSGAAPFAGNAAGRDSDRAAVAAAAAGVLVSFFPAETERLLTEVLAGLSPTAPPSVQRAAAAAHAIGAQSAARVLAHAASDGADAVWDGAVPAGDGLWFSSAQPPVPPLLPLWGSVRPWLMSRGDQFRPPPPPAFGSAEFAEALAEVRHISDTRTDEQLRSALYWADDPGTATPPGHWNAIAADLIRAHRLPELRAAWTLALLNMALMDAAISCWDAKYVYWLLRPSHADPLITTAVPLPNFPSYTSGHATFSGAAGELLGSIFPAHRQRLLAMAEEAADSRVYGGIHYRFDSDVGLVAGRAIGRLAVERGHRLNPGAAAAVSLR